MELISKTLHFTVENWFLIFQILVFGVMAGVFLISFILKLRKSNLLPLAGVISAILGVIILLWSSDMNNIFVNTFGIEGKVVIKEIKPTHLNVDDVPVLEYEVELFTKEHKVIETSVTSDTLNGAPAILEQGVTYSAKYIPGDDQNVLFPIR